MTKFQLPKYLKLDNFNEIYVFYEIKRLFFRRYIATLLRHYIATPFRRFTARRPARVFISSYYIKFNAAGNDSTGEGLLAFVIVELWL